MQRFFRLLRFPDPELEREFRLAALPGDRRQAALTIAVAVPVGLAFVISDYWLFGWSAGMVSVVGARLVFALLGIAALVAILRARSSRAYDAWVTLWLLTVAVLLLGVDSTRPATYTGHAILEVLAVLLFYTAIRLSPLVQAVAAGLLSLGVLATFAFLKDPREGPMTFVVVVVSLALANGLGFVLAIQMERYRRAQFSLLRQERGLRASLEKAVAEIQTLRGILPICANCKKIRDGDGAWHPVEAYVEARSEAAFTHGVCPECEVRLYS